jgi:CheY-like chemotaxis protein
VSSVAAPNPYPNACSSSINIEHREPLAEHLGRRHNVSTATNGTEALNVAVRIPPDVVVLDFELADMSGADVLRWIRTLPPGSRHRDDRG